MNLELKNFQKQAVADLLNDLASAKDEVARPGRPRLQALLLSAPTASGKTVITAALIEKILGGAGGVADELPFDPEPDAVFLWLSDQPELNRQSRERLLSASNWLRPHDLVLIGSDFDAESFDSGKVFFLNSQKLGRDKLLTRYGDGRHWTIWETIRNTQARLPNRFYVIIDEAHRGMNVPSQEREQAKSTVQKFIVGSPEARSWPRMAATATTAASRLKRAPCCCARSRSDVDGSMRSSMGQRLIRSLRASAARAGMQ
ncbi:MAG: putative helicase [Nitrobacter vulgaris]|nr:putative helicase [Nitrobacter vulgaris]